MANLVLPLHVSGGSDPFGRAVRERQPIVVPTESIEDLPGAFREALLPTSDVLIVPMKTGSAVRAVLFADSKFSPYRIDTGKLGAVLELLLDFTTLATLDQGTSLAGASGPAICSRAGSASAV